MQEALETCGRFLIILSPDSVKSENVQDEIAVALDENKTIVPVLYRECKFRYVCAACSGLISAGIFNRR